MPRHVCAYQMHMVEEVVTDTQPNEDAMATYIARALAHQQSPNQDFMDSFNNFSILSWNIRGAPSRDTRRHIRDLAKSHKPSLFCICETHVPFSRVAKFWTSLGYKPLFLQEARGHSGGLWVLANTSDTSFALVDSMQQAITFSVNRRSDTWYCSFIYASPIFANRCRLWDHLQLLRGQIQAPWVLLGDFNDILYSSEVSGGAFNSGRAALLAQMMLNCNLLDIHSFGGLFTWRHNVRFVGHVRKKLDRVVSDVDWQLAFPHSIVEVLSQHASDHNPLLLSCTKFKSKRAKLFHFQAAWMTHPDYELLVNHYWTQTHGDVVAKLDQIRKQSLAFNKDTFGNIFKRKRKIEARIKGVHLQLDLCPSSDLVRLESDLQREYSTVLREEEILWFQKSREK